MDRRTFYDVNWELLEEKVDDLYRTLPKVQKVLYEKEQKGFTKSTKGTLYNTIAETTQETTQNDTPNPSKGNDNASSNNQKKEVPDWKSEERFNKFWELYEKKGNRKRAFANWNKLTKEQLSVISKKLNAYIGSTPDKQFRKNAETYLNPANEYWNDEVVDRNNSSNSNYQHEVEREFSTEIRFG